MLTKLMRLMGLVIIAILVSSPALAPTAFEKRKHVLNIAKERQQSKSGYFVLTMHVP